MAKIFTWYGKTEEEIKQLDMKEFMELLPSRRRRSLKRGLTEPQKVLLQNIESNQPNIKTHCRNMVVLPVMLGKTIRIHNGKDFVPIIIVPEMLGHCLGEFAHSRKMVSHSSAGVGATRSSKATSAR